MIPFKGQGANQALLDALSLARSKVKAPAEAAQFLHSSVAIQEGSVTRGAAASSEKNL